MNQSELISVKNISKTYHLGDVQIPALKQASLTIRRGDFMVITGRNGSGKSTLLHQLGLLDRPDSGQIILEGQDVTAMRESDRSSLRLKYLGYIFQEYALVAELTALENVLLPALMAGLPDARERAGALLEKVGLGTKTKHLPRQLSGGEQQKVAIARSLVNNPVVIFADEPTANLDSIAARDVIELFKKFNAEDHDTIVMITHEQEETVHANRIIRLADGKIL